ncbi:MAG: hypothetical protein CBC29_06095 [Methylococcaceae bacterium TMED69]|nr:MAG: hypothetical protein CBC29_06095 [Methylococcaceae bacterium TMED69]|tara:strand:- start:2196 stop:2864 length:669 start_codon:yes stop_codon:yes gene_type:complete
MFDMSRQNAQFASLFFVATAVLSILILPNGFSIAPILGFFSIWSLVISESFLLTRVKNEMSNTLETLRKKQEADIQDLLYFLRSYQIAASPFESIDGAKKFCDKIHYPAMVLSANHQIIKANKDMHEILGWDFCKKELNKKPAHIINDAVLMSVIGETMAKPENMERKSMITQYAYVHKSGKKIFGQMDASKIGVEGFFVVFHPSKNCVFSAEDIEKMVRAK